MTPHDEIAALKQQVADLQQSNGELLLILETKVRVLECLKAAHVELQGVLHAVCVMPKARKALRVVTH